MNKDYRKLYFLEAIAQGAMDVHTEVHLSYELETHAVKCSKCGGTVAGNSAWEHFALECPFTNSGPQLPEGEECLPFQIHKEQARAEVAHDRELADLWLQGLTPWSEMPDPLDNSFKYQITWGGRLPVQGAILAGDGSGGKFSSNPILRRCGFGLACILPHRD